jgi:hypothetical protein
MKQLILAVILFSLFIHSPAFAQEMSSESAGLNPIETIDYTLPYPGILPDNPLYPLKAFRDRIVSLLIADTVKKSLFDLLQADKRLQSAAYLLYTNDAKHIQLAETTISKGENYFEEAVSQIEVARKQGRHVSTEIRELTVATQKHQEVLTDLKAQVPEKEKNAFVSFSKRMEHIQQILKNIPPAK